MISAIFTTIGEAITGFTGALSSALGSITEMFYVSSGDNAGLTVLGVLSLIAVGVGLVYWAFRLIRRLVSQRRA